MRSTRRLAALAWGLSVVSALIGVAELATVGVAVGIAVVVLGGFLAYTLMMHGREASSVAPAPVVPACSAAQREVQFDRGASGAASHVDAVTARRACAGRADDAGSSTPWAGTAPGGSGSVPASAGSGRESTSSASSTREALAAASPLAPQAPLPPLPPSAGPVLVPDPLDQMLDPEESVDHSTAAPAAVTVFLVEAPAGCPGFSLGRSLLSRLGEAGTVVLGDGNHVTVTTTFVVARVEIDDRCLRDRLSGRGLAALDRLVHDPDDAEALGEFRRALRLPNASSDGGAVKLEAHSENVSSFHFAGDVVLADRRNVEVARTVRLGRARLDLDVLLFNDAGLCRALARSLRDGASAGHRHAFERDLAGAVDGTQTAWLLHEVRGIERVRPPAGGVGRKPEITSSRDVTSLRADFTPGRVARGLTRADRERRKADLAEPTGPKARPPGVRASEPVERGAHQARVRRGGFGPRGPSAGMAGP